MDRTQKLLPQSSLALDQGKFQAMTLCRDLVIGTAGHIDHGKTALVRALTGVDCDRLPAEKARGITIDLGYAALKCGTNCISLVDVPGHERFIRNMLAGATGLDSALLVVAADDGVMPQTREHLDILKLLGLAGGIVVLTKCDLATPDWLDLVEDDIRALTAKSFLENADIIRTCARSGLGIDRLKTTLANLSETLAPRIDPGPFRMAIDRVFSRPGHGTIVTGTVLSGRVGVGDELEWLPEGRRVRVRGLHRHDLAVDSVARGTRAAINITGVNFSEVTRGDELAEPGYLKPSRILSVQVTSSPGAAHHLQHRTRYRLHLGTSEVAATLSLLDRNRLAPGEDALGQLFTDRPVVAISGQPFVLRLESPAVTLGGGCILEPVAKRSRRQNQAKFATLVKMMTREASDRLSAAIDSLGYSSWTDLDLVRSSGIPLSEVGQRVNTLSHSGDLVQFIAGGNRVVRVTLESAIILEDRVLKAICRLHDKNPRHSAIRRTHLGAELPDLDASRIIEPILSRLMQDGRLIGDQSTVALASFRPSLSHAERKLKNELVEAFHLGGFTPPEVASFIGRPGADKRVIRELLDLLVEEGYLVAISPTLYLEAENEVEMRTRAQKQLLESGSMTMAELRDMLGTTRKFAVPFGEYLDRIGLTTRDGDLRTLGPATTKGASNE